MPRVRFGELPGVVTTATAREPPTPRRFEPFAAHANTASADAGAAAEDEESENHPQPRSEAGIPRPRLPGPPIPPQTPRLEAVAKAGFAATALDNIANTPRASKPGGYVALGSRNCDYPATSLSSTAGAPASRADATPYMPPDPLTAPSLIRTGPRGSRNQQARKGSCSCQRPATSADRFAGGISRPPGAPSSLLRPESLPGASRSLGSSEREVGATIQLMRPNRAMARPAQDLSG